MPRRRAVISRSNFLQRIEAPVSPWLGGRAEGEGSRARSDAQGVAGEAGRGIAVCPKVPEIRPRHARPIRPPAVRGRNRRKPQGNVPRLCARFLNDCWRRGYAHRSLVSFQRCSPLRSGWRFHRQGSAAGDRIIISAISLAEMIYLIEKGRLPANAYAGVKAALDDPDHVFKEAPLI